MVLSIIATIFLIFGTISMFIASPGYSIPIWAKFIPLLAAFALWGCRLLKWKSGKTGIAGILLLAFFYAVTIFYTLPSVIFLWVGNAGDIEKNIPVSTSGNAESEKTIFIIYHPGFSPFTTNIIHGISDEAGEEGYKIVLYCVNKNLKINLNKASAVVISSPLYFGRIRPPLINYIRNNDFRGIRTFILLTCGSPYESNQKNYLDECKSEIAGYVPEIMGGEAFSLEEKPAGTKIKIRQFVKEIEDKIR
jgi:hypothetical protein